MTATSSINWGEALPFVQRLYHETPGISGYFPHKLVFGRDRHLAGCPTRVPWGRRLKICSKKWLTEKGRLGKIPWP